MRAGGEGASAPAIHTRPRAAHRAPTRRRSPRSRPPRGRPRPGGARRAGLVARRDRPGPRSRPAPPAGSLGRALRADRGGRRPARRSLLPSAPAERRGDGATYTPAPIVEAMVAWVAGEGRPARVVDPGAGSGRFAVAAGRPLRRGPARGGRARPARRRVCRGHLAAAGLAGRAAWWPGDYRSAEIGRDGDGHPLPRQPALRAPPPDPAGWKEWLTLAGAPRAWRPAGSPACTSTSAPPPGARRPGDRGPSSPPRSGSTRTTAAWCASCCWTAWAARRSTCSSRRPSPPMTPPSPLPSPASAPAGAWRAAAAAGRRRPAARRLEGGRPVPAERLREARRWSPALTRAGPRRPRGPHPARRPGPGPPWRGHRAQLDLGRPAPARPTSCPTVLFPSVTRAREIFDAGCPVLDRPPAPGRRPAPTSATSRGRAAPHRGLPRPRAPRGGPRGLHRPARRRVVVGRAARRPRRSWRPTWPAARRRSPATSPAPGTSTSPTGSTRASSCPTTAIDRLLASLRRTVSVHDGRTYAGGLTKFEPREMERLPVPDPLAEGP